MFLLLVALSALLKHATIGEALRQNETRYYVDLFNQTPECPDYNCQQKYSNPCDYSCRVYSVCCHEKASAYLHAGNTSKVLPDTLPQSPKRWQCRPLLTVTGITMWMYMVSTCPAEWQDPQVSLRCSKSDRLISGYTHIIDVPVLSADSNILYANVYCAVCNNDTTEITGLSMEFKCNNNNLAPAECISLLDTAAYNPGELRWRSRNVIIKATMSGFPYSKRCGQFSKMCESQTNTSLVTKQRNMTHVDRKPECWQYTDPIDTSYLYLAEDQDACQRIHTNVATCARGPKTLRDFVSNSASFSLILDFRGGGNVGLASSCAINQMYDSVRKSCVDIFCGQNYEMAQDGRCVPRRTNSTNTTEYGGLADACVKIVVSLHEYTYVNSSTIRVNRTDDKVFETQSFEKRDDGSVLICAPDTVTAYTNKFSAVQGLLSSVCLILSLSCLAVHILVYGSIAKLRNLPGKNLLSLSCSIFIAQLLFYAGINLKRPRVVCVAIGATTHLSYLASFFWMNVMAFDMCRTFTSKSAHRGSPSQQRRTFARYAAYAWMWPCLLVTAALVLDATEAIPDLKPSYAEPYCWINNRTSLAIFLALPLFVLLVENIIFFTMTACAIKRVTADAAVAVKGSTASERTRFFLYLKLAFIVGLTWIFGYIAALADLEPLWYLFILLNSLQGAFIFFAFTFKRKIFSMVLDMLPKKSTSTRAKQEDPETTVTSIRTTTDGKLLN